MATISTNTLQLYSWNVNGIRAVDKKGSLITFLEQHDPDILCLQEIKANQDQINETLSIGETLQKYYFQINAAEKKGYSGTALLSKDEPLNVVFDIPENIAKKYELADKFGDTNKEGRIIVCEFAEFYVSTMYTPNVKKTLERLALRVNWDNAVLEYIQELEKIKPVLFCGDLNVAHNDIDLARPKQNVGKAGFTTHERAGLQHFVDADFIDTFRNLYPETVDVYTWWSARGGARENNVGWRIDYWMSSASLKDNIVDAKVHMDIMGSDHCPISVEVKIS